jgi:surfactin synthase thioesterase subunit
MAWERGIYFIYGMPVKALLPGADKAFGRSVDSFWKAASRWLILDLSSASEGNSFVLDATTGTADTDDRAVGASLLVCLPPSGAGRSFFREWPREVGGAEVLPLSLPGHEERSKEPMARSVAAAAAEAADRVLRHRPARVVLFGHSLGAAVAFETACLLEAHDIALSLVVSARQAPHLPSGTAGLAAADDSVLLETLARWGGVALPGPDHPLAALLLPALRGDFAISAEHTWNGRRPLAPLISVSYSGDRVVPEPSVRAWREIAGGDYRHVTEPGDHYAARAPSAGLIRTLTGALARAHPAGPGLRAVGHQDAAAAEGVE